jgi:hypothetical protein
MTSSARYTGVRTKKLKYVRYDSGYEQLFNLAEDPHELRNEAGQARYADKLASLRSLNERLKSCSGASCFVP